MVHIIDLADASMTGQIDPEDSDNELIEIELADASMTGQADPKAGTFLDSLINRRAKGLSSWLNAKNVTTEEG